MQWGLMELVFGLAHRHVEDAFYFVLEAYIFYYSLRDTIYFCQLSLSYAKYDLVDCLVLFLAQEFGESCFQAPASVGTNAFHSSAPLQSTDLCQAY